MLGEVTQPESSWLRALAAARYPAGEHDFVARDISGIDLHQIIIDTSPIFSELAVSAASLAVLSN
jgi:hypothetical protein